MTPLISSLDALPPSARTLPPPPVVAQPEIGAPRECKLVARFLPDASLRYAKVPLGGSGLVRVVLLLAALVVGVVSSILGLLRLVDDRHVSFWNLLLLGSLLVPLVWPLVPRAWADLRTRLFFRRLIGPLELGLDRAIFQPGNQFRYELHIAASRAVSMHDLQLRLVFWESWQQRQRSRWLRLPVWKWVRQGHDLARHTVQDLTLERGQHAVIRGEIGISRSRPTEHQRGERKHLTYVNITTTLVLADGREPVGVRGDAPRLIPFPWM